MIRLLTELAFIAIAGFLLLNVNLEETRAEYEVRLEALNYEISQKRGGVSDPYTLCMPECERLHKQRDNGHYLYFLRPGRPLVYFYYSSPETITGDFGYGSHLAELTFYDDLWFGVTTRRNLDGTLNPALPGKPVCLTAGRGEEAELRCAEAFDRHEKGTL